MLLPFVYGGDPTLVLPMMIGLLAVSITSYNAADRSASQVAASGDALMQSQREVADMGGTMRLGADPIKLHDQTRARDIYGEAVVYERHRHRYEVNNFLRKRLERAGLVVSGTPPDERLVEMVEIAAHPFFVASQFHPEFKSRPQRPAPLFRDFVGAAREHAAERLGEAADAARGVGAEEPAGRFQHR